MAQTPIFSVTSEQPRATQPEAPAADRAPGARPEAGPFPRRAQGRSGSLLRTGSGGWRRRVRMDAPPRGARPRAWPGPASRLSSAASPGPLLPAGLCLPSACEAPSCEAGHRPAAGSGSAETLGRASPRGPESKPGALRSPSRHRANQDTSAQSPSCLKSESGQPEEGRGPVSVEGSRPWGIGGQPGSLRVAGRPGSAPSETAGGASPEGVREPGGVKAHAAFCPDRVVHDPAARTATTCALGRRGGHSHVWATPAALG